MTQHSFEAIVVDLAKLRDYCLSDSHPRGRHKARVFRSRLGLTQTDAETLRQALLTAAKDRKQELKFTGEDAYGHRYQLDFDLTTSTGTARLRSSWIVLTGEKMLRLTSCYIL